MTALIQINQTAIGGTMVQTVNARTLYDYLENGSEFRHWIKDRIEQYGFVESVDFTTSEKIIRGGRAVEYHITIDMAKELSMVERNDKGKQARQYFLECERQAKSAPVKRGNPSLDAFRQARAIEIAERTAERLCARFSNLGQPAQQVIYAKILNPVAGSDVVPLPLLESRTYTATDIADELNVSANTIGRTANANGLKTTEFGMFVLDKSRSSDKQVESFRYNETGRARLTELLRKPPLHSVPPSPPQDQQHQ